MSTYCVHLVSNSLLNPHQSAYYKHHSTETTLLYVHDYLSNAIRSHKYIVDLSATFDTNDQNILISHLSS